MQYARLNSAKGSPSFCSRRSFNFEHVCNLTSLCQNRERTSLTECLLVQHWGSHNGELGGKSRRRGRVQWHVNTKPHRGVPLPSSHKIPKSNDRYRCVVQSSGTLVRVCLKEKIHQKRKGGGVRNGVSFFSRQFRQRFMFKKAMICWDSIPKSRFFYLRVTFLPPQGSLARSKACLRSYRKRLSAFLGSDGYSVVWKQEYMRNGHWHAQICSWWFGKCLALLQTVTTSSWMPSSRPTAPACSPNGQLVPGAGLLVGKTSNSVRRMRLGARRVIRLQ